MLYVVATPIGNLGDISQRAIDVLRRVDYLAVEDTRHSRRLLDHLGLSTPMFACHDHNEQAAADKIVRDLLAGQSIALISDAGTPLISDPGYRLVTAAVAAGVQVVPIPGASAITAALSVAAQPTDRFCFEGFLPSKLVARKSRLTALSHETRTMVFYEAPHRIEALLETMVDVMGGDRAVTLARELTKTFEQLWFGNTSAALAAIRDGTIPTKGEFVVVLQGGSHEVGNLDERRVMELLLAEVSPATAASLGSQILGVGRKHLYEVALSLKKR